MNIVTDPQTILIVDDDQVILKVLSTKLAAAGFTVFTAKDTSEALAVTRGARPDLILLDVLFPREVGHGSGAWDGLALMGWIRQVFGDIPMIIMSGTDVGDIRNRALAMGAVHFFQKSVGMGELLGVIRDALSADPSKAAATA